MNDTTNTAAQANGTQVQDTPAKLYATKGEAEAAKASDAPKSLKAMEVKKSGTAVGWILGRGYDHALAQVARSEGYSVSTGKASAVVTKEMVSAKVMEMTDEEFRALVAARKAAKK